MNSLQEAFRYQSTTCTNLGSPFMGQLLGMLADHWPDDSALARKCATFEGDIGPAGVSLPLRIAGGLHALAMQGQELAKVYPPNAVSEHELRDATLAAILDHAEFLCDWIDLPPQTNELRRSAMLIAGAHAAVRCFDLPIVLSELGASAGLNLFWDHYALEVSGVRSGSKEAVVVFTPDWDGPAPLCANPVIVDRRGVDLNPLDPTDAADLSRMTAYLWADQPNRLEMTRKAAAIATPVVDKGDAIEWLEQRLEQVEDGRLHLIQNTVAWQYFPAEAQARGQRLIQEAGQRATPERPLAWLTFETDGDTNGLGGGAITLRLWPGDVTLHLGRADFHGRWVRWQAPAGGRRV